jgi:hypothetical protein
MLLLIGRSGSLGSRFSLSPGLVGFFLFLVNLGLGSLLSFSSLLLHL